MLFTLYQKAQLAISTDLIIINKTVQENMLIQKKKHKQNIFSSCNKT